MPNISWRAKGDGVNHHKNDNSNRFKTPQIEREANIVYMYVKICVYAP